MSTLLEIMDALAAQLHSKLDGEIPGIQIEGRMNINPSPDPVALDIYPGDPFQEPDAFGLGENDIMLTIRARVNTPDSEGAQDALLALMDPKAATSVEQAVLSDTTLSSVVGNLRIESPASNYGIFPDASGAAAFLGCTWTVRIIPLEVEVPVGAGYGADAYGEAGYGD